MQSVSFVLLLGTLVWVAACLVAVLAIWKRRKANMFFPEHGLQAAGIALLAIGTGIALIFLAVDGTTTFWAGGIHAVFAALLFAGSYRARRHRLNPGASDSMMSFREKSAMLVLLALVVIFLGYFTRTWGVTPDVVIPEFIGAIALLIFIMIIGHIAIALYHAPLDEVNDSMDERDRVVELKSVRNAYYTMVSGFWIIPVLLIMSLPALVIANVSLAILVLSEVVKYGSILAYYRFGE